ncbi:MAG: L-lactate permease [Zavarzinella sp.]
MFLLEMIPLVLLLGLVVFARWPLNRAAPLSLAAMVVYRLVQQNLIIAAPLKGLLVGIDICLILVGAMAFLEHLKSNGQITQIQEELGRMTTNKVVQALLLAWIFGSFVEGISGFGTPAMLIAPLMVALGFRPLSAVVVCLLANSTAVIFGAVGTPVTVGFEGLFTDAGFVRKAALVSLLSSWLIPFFIVRSIVKLEELPGVSFREQIRLSMLFAVVFLVPFYLCARWAYEFASIIAPLIALFIILGIYKHPHPRRLILAMKAYFIVIVLLILSRILLGKVTETINLGSGLSHTLRLNNPGIVFLLYVLAARGQRHIRSTLTKLSRVFVAVSSLACLSYLYFVSGFFHEIVDQVGRQLYFLLAIPLGAVGSFLAGSATVSNLFFANLIPTVYALHQLDPQILLMMQLLGAGAGNMIALQNMAAVQAAVSLHDQENRILKQTLIPCLIYIALMVLWARLLYF